MISSIDKLENLGIYSAIPPKTASDFKRFNLIYGWNGSGKSTMSRLFSFVGGHKISKEYDKLKVTITVDENQYTEKQFPLSNEYIAVFNEDFVKDNIDWNGTLKSILLLDEGNIEEVKKYNAIKLEVYGDENATGLIKKIDDRKEKLNKSESELQKLLTSISTI